MTDVLKNSKLYRAEVPGRELLECEVDSTGAEHLKVVASPLTTQLIRQLLKQTKKVSDWPLPEGNGPSDILVRELILKVQDKWKFPIDDPELCHCRAVPAVKVDQAIVSGAHTVEKVRRMTSANTACGTCLPEVEKLLNFRLRK